MSSLVVSGINRKGFFPLRSVTLSLERFAVTKTLIALLRSIRLFITILILYLDLTSSLFLLVEFHCLLAISTVNGNAPVVLPGHS